MIRTISQIILVGHEDGPFSRVSMVDEQEQSRQCTTELHDLMREVRNGMVIDTKPGVIHQYMWLMAVFHLNGHQGQSEVFVQDPDLLQRQDHPEASINKVTIR